MTVYLPLAGPDARGGSPKACKVTGWNEWAYKGIDPFTFDGWVGMRLDELIVVDCDCACKKVGGRKPDVCETPEAAYRARADWLKRLASFGVPTLHTWERKTPHGYHLIYQRVGGVESRKLSSISPTLELKTGIGHQIVYRAPGYDDFTLCSPTPFDPAWLPPAVAVRAADEWSELPDGIGESFMISMAGKLRQWGADESTLRACLEAINAQVMTVAPMPPRSIRRIARSAARYAPDDVDDLAIFECPTCSGTWEGS